jgi:uncharacterized membrane protein YhaH (DUF805 family)
MLAAIKYNLAHLLDFSGREDRPTFWWYVLFLIIIDIVLGLVVTGSMMGGGFSEGIQAAQSGASQQDIQAQMLQHMSDRMGTVIWLSAGINLLVTALSVAAFVRRLHDSGNSGWWAAIAVLAQVASIAGALMSIPQLELLGWVAPLIVVIFGVMKSSSGANRYGEGPQPS